jgi:hypothetical protein
VSCNIYPDKKCLIVISEATNDISTSADLDKCVSPASIYPGGNTGFQCKLNMKKNEIDMRRRIIDESYCNDETDIEGKENVLLTENEQNKGDNVQKSLQMQIMQQKCPFLWKTNDSLIGIGKKLIRIDKDRNRMRNKTKLNGNNSPQISYSPSSSTSSVTSVLKYEQDKRKPTVQNKIDKRDSSSFSVSSTYDSDDILSSLGGDYDISDNDLDKRGTYIYVLLQMLLSLYMYA